MPALLGTPFLGEVHRLLLCLVCGTYLSLSFGIRVGILWQNLDAQELKPQTIYAIEDAEEMRLVYDSPVRIVSPSVVSILMPSKAAAYRLLSSLLATMR
jgi:hypothetical protein